MDIRYHIDKNHISHPLRFGSFLFFQIGRMHCAEETVVPTHSHVNLFELTVVTGGLGQIFTNGAPVPVKRGDIHLSFPGDFHAIVADRNDPLKFDFYSFNTEDPDYAAELENIMQRCAKADARVFRDENIRRLVENAIAEFDGKGEYREKLLASSFEQIAIYLIRDFKQNSPAQRKGDATRAEELCYQMMNYIDTHVYSLAKLEELAEIFGYTYSYLSEIFKKTTSSTLLEYYRSRRLETARLLLDEGCLSVTKIAELLNYSSIYAFSKAFKEKYGVSPKRYQ